jgi:hypothetical protein
VVLTPRWKYRSTAGATLGGALTGFWRGWNTFASCPEVGKWYVNSEPEVAEAAQ